MSANAREGDGAPAAATETDAPVTPSARPSEQLQERRDSSAVAGTSGSAAAVGALDGSATPRDVSRPSGGVEEAPAAASSSTAPTEEVVAATPADAEPAGHPQAAAEQPELEPDLAPKGGNVQAAGSEAAPAGETPPEDDTQSADALSVPPGEDNATESGVSEPTPAAEPVVIFPSRLRPQLMLWMVHAVQRVRDNEVAAHAAEKLHGGAKGVSMLLLPGLVRAARRYRGRLPWLRPVRATLHRPDPSDLQLKGHTASVRCLLLLHDGLVASCSSDKTIRVWEAHTHTCVSVLAGHTGHVNAVIELPDGRLASGSGDHTVRIWQRARALCDAVFEEHTGSVTSLTAVRPAGAIISAAGGARIAATSPKYRRFVSAGCDCVLKVWDANTLLCLSDLRGHTEFVMCVAPVTVSTVISGSWDKTLKLWDITTGNCVRTMKGHLAGVNTVAVMADGRVVSGGLDRTLRTWDISAGVCERLLEGHQMWITSVLSMRDGIVGSTSRDGCIRLWNVDIGVCDRVIEAHRQSTNALLQLPNGHLLTASDDSSIRIWNLADESSERPIGGHTGAVRVLRLLAYKHEGFVVSGSDDRTLRLWEIATGYCKRVFQGHRAAVVAIADMGEGQIVSGSHDSQVRLWDLTTGLCARVMDGHVARVSAVVAAEGGRIVSGSMDEDIRVWEAATGDILHTFKAAHKGGVTAVAAAMDGQGFVISAGKDSTIRCWNVVNAKLVNELTGHRSWVQSVSLLDTGRLISASMDTTFRVWNLPWQKLRSDGHVEQPPIVERCESVVRGFGGNPDTIVQFPQAALVVASASDGTLRCWSLKTGECAAVFESLLGKVRNVSSLPMPGYSPPNSPPSSPPRPVSRSSSNLKARLSAAMNAGAAAKASSNHAVTLQPVVFSTEGGFISGIVPPKKDTQMEKPALPSPRESLPKRPHWETSQMLQRSPTLAAGPVLTRRGTLTSFEEHAQDARAPEAGPGRHEGPGGGGHGECRFRASEGKGQRASIVGGAGRFNAARQFFADGDSRSPSALPEWGRPLAHMYIAPPPVGHVVTVSTRLNVTGHVDSDDEDGVGPEATFVIAGSGNGRMHFFKYTQQAAPS